MSSKAEGVKATLKRGVTGASAQLADGVSRVVGDAVADRLEWLMHSPARRVVLEAVFWQMPKHLDDRRAARVSAVVRWHITGRADGGRDVYDLEISDGRARILRGGRTADPRLTITIDGSEFLRLISGNLDALQAYFTGRLALSGDIMFAAKLVSLFRVPERQG